MALPNPPETPGARLDRPGHRHGVTAVDTDARDRHLSSGKLSAVIRYTEHGMPQFVAKD